MGFAGSRPIPLLALTVGMFVWGGVSAPRIVSVSQLQPDFTLARGRIGALRIGMTADRVVALFGEGRVKQVDLQLEGHASPALEIRLGNPPAVRASLTAELNVVRLRLVPVVRSPSCVRSRPVGLGASPVPGEIPK
jgi:hypothetical protein